MKRKLGLMHNGDVHSEIPELTMGPLVLSNSPHPLIIYDCFTEAEIESCN